MTKPKMILIYITCESLKQAKEIGALLLKKNLAGCINIIPEVQPMFIWPPGSGKIDESKEVILLVKSIEEKYEKIEKKVLSAHSFDTVCIFAIPVMKVGKKYYEWLLSEIK
ncbi:divalent-cation tolerance protein CutA [Candidatus Dojkabacteria bacterium]|nr:divalent-cation tolerance protein CutA [Candidatus Dojkabacteria bacterium]